MASMNKVMLIGNVGNDPETATTNGGKMISKFRLATNYKTKQDKVTEWHKIITFDKLAEIVASYVKKGRCIYIEGRIQTREFQTKEGNKAYITEIIASEMQLLDKQPDIDSDSNFQGTQQNNQQSGGFKNTPQNNQQRPQQQNNQQRPQQQAQQQQTPNFDDNFDF